MSLPLSLQNYLSDLGLTAPDVLNMAFVRQLQSAHVARYSFNNLAVVLGEGISLDLDEISDKIVMRGLGGYCFEHNKLTFELLHALGYEVELKLARVLNNHLDRDVGRTHRMTVLTLEGVRYLVDTGFGGNGPIMPIALVVNTEQTAGLDRYRILATDKGEYDLQVLKDDDFFTLYRFDSAVYTNADCELGHFYSHKHPNAVFLKHLMVTLKKEHQMVTLVNEKLTTRDRQGERVCVIESPESLGRILGVEFNIELDSMLVTSLFERFVMEKLPQ